MELCDEKDCTGCMACVNVCPNEALDIVTDKEGFDHPKLNEKHCVDCGLCEKACPILNPIIRNIKEQQVYACWTNDKQLRLKSSSGGLFTELARVVLLKGGIVFGVALDKNLTVHHTYVMIEKELSKLRGSKYVQSRIEETYKTVKKFLHEEKTVLFSGTPCQIAGLRGYLGKDYNTLFTTDIICHGVPSPMIFEEYKSYMEQKLDAKIEDIKFRGKKYSWTFFNISINESIEKEKGKNYIGKYYSDPYLRGFLRDYFLRPSCYECKFTNMNRMGDVTIADYWGYKGKNKEDKKCEELGVSLAIVNTEKGNQLFNVCKPQLTYYQKTIEDAYRTNRSLVSPFPAPLTRDAFWKDYYTLAFEEVVRKWMKPERIPMYLYLTSNYEHTALMKVLITGTQFLWRVWNKINKIFKLNRKRTI